MNIAAVIGEVIEVRRREQGGVYLALRVADRRQGQVVIGALADGPQAAACLAYLRPGARVGVEGSVRPGAVPAELIAERVQFLAVQVRAEAA